MKIGDLVEALRAKDMLIRRGIILKRIKPPTPDNWLETFEVMTSDGQIDTYTSTALRVINLIYSSSTWRPGQRSTPATATTGQRSM